MSELTIIGKERSETNELKKAPSQEGTEAIVTAEGYAFRIGLSTSEPVGAAVSILGTAGAECVIEILRLMDDPDLGIGTP